MAMLSERPLGFLTMFVGTLLPNNLRNAVLPKNDNLVIIIVPERRKNVPGDFERTQNAILESAKSNFLACGYERANLRKICKDAGITTGALYRHFPDKKRCSPH